MGRVFNIMMIYTGVFIMSILVSLQTTIFKIDKSKIHVIDSDSMTKSAAIVIKAALNYSAAKRRRY